MNKQELINFEQDIADTYHKGLIRSPCHLSGSINGELEDFLIVLFKEIKPNDWIFTTYRSHYHALLKGMPKEELKKWILENKSIHLMSKKYKIVSSAIVGGTLSQAVGCAMAIKRKGGKEKVYAFCGDMTASLGVFQDCLNYATTNNLPITFIIEDNGLSTDTPTKKAWRIDYISEEVQDNEIYDDHYEHIVYQRKWQHYGATKQGEQRKFVEFKT